MYIHMKVLVLHSTRHLFVILVINAHKKNFSIKFSSSGVKIFSVDFYVKNALTPRINSFNLFIPWIHQIILE